MDLKAAPEMDKAYTFDASGKKKEPLYIIWILNIIWMVAEEIIGTLRSATRQAQNVKTQCELVEYSKGANALGLFYLISKMLATVLSLSLSLSTSSKYNLIKTPYIT